MSNWSIVTTMLGVPEAILPCIAHHLATDVDKIFVYLDAPLPEIESALSSHPRCIVTVCNEAYWARFPQGRPDRNIKRQLANVEHARAQCSSEWMVHLDSDEFLVRSRDNDPLRLNDSLAEIPLPFEWARIFPMERVLPSFLQQSSIFDGIFRGRTSDKRLIKKAYGSASTFLRHGLSGHVRGKIAFRRGTKLMVRIHDLIFPPPPGVSPPVVFPDNELPAFVVLKDTVLLHFEGWTPLHWASKFIKFVEDGRFNGHHAGRRNSVRYMADNLESASRTSLFERVQRLSEGGHKALLEANVLRTLSFHPEEICRVTFPDLTFDFEVSAFDKRLRDAQSAFFLRNNL